MKILLVEDDEGVASSTILLLELSGHQVEWAGTIRDANAMLGVSNSNPLALQPDVILSDYQLPDGTGIEFLAGVIGRAKPGAASTLLILWSGTDRNAQIRAAALRSVQFVRKGFGAFEKIGALIDVHAALLALTEDRT